MKKLTTIVAIILLPGTFMINAQKSYVTSMKFTFSGGSEFGTPIGNDCGNMDVTKMINSIDGIMQVDVNKICHTWSFLQHWMGGAYAQSMVFRQRYFEMRIKSTAAHSDGCSVRFNATSGVPDDSPGTPIPDVKYKINRSDTWEIKYFKLGGTKDTIFSDIEYSFDNGSYYIDYVLMGDAAAPPVPTIDQVKTKYAYGTSSVTLTNVSIPDRETQDGLAIDVTTAKDGILTNVKIVDQGYGTFVDPATRTAVVQFEVAPDMHGFSDSIIVLVKDTIRGGLKTMAFNVHTFVPSGLTENLSDENSVSVYPNVTDEKVSVETAFSFSGQISVCDLNGKEIIQKESENSYKTDIDISSLPAGMYLVRISNNNDQIIKKIIKK